MTTNIKQLSSNEDNARLLAIPLEEVNSPNTLGQMPKDLLGVVRGFLSAEDNNSLKQTCKTLHSQRKVRVIDYKGMWDEFKTDPKMRLFMPRETKNYERNIENLYLNMRRHLNALNGKPDSDIKLQGDIKTGLQNLLNQIADITPTYHHINKSLGFLISYLNLVTLLVLSILGGVIAFGIAGHIILALIPTFIFAGALLSVAVSHGITRKCDSTALHKIKTLKGIPEAPRLGNIPFADDQEPLPPKFELPLPNLKPVCISPLMSELPVRHKRKPIPRRTPLDLLMRAEKHANKKVQFPSYEPKHFELTDAERTQLDEVD